MTKLALLPYLTLGSAECTLCKPVRDMTEKGGPTQQPGWTLVRVHAMHPVVLVQFTSTR